MRETIAIFEELAGRALEIRDHPAVPGDQRRTKADTSLIRRRARLGADDDAARGARGPVGVGRC